jgi:hypothetical protein
MNHSIAFHFPRNRFFTAWQKCEVEPLQALWIQTDAVEQEWSARSEPIRSGYGWTLPSIRRARQCPFAGKPTSILYRCRSKSLETDALGCPLVLVIVEHFICQFPSRPQIDFWTFSCHIVFSSSKQLGTDMNAVRPGRPLCALNYCAEFRASGEYKTANWVIKKLRFSMDNFFRQSRNEVMNQIHSLKRELEADDFHFTIPLLVRLLSVGRRHGRL